jgi:hypothetical protein
MGTHTAAGRALPMGSAGEAMLEPPGGQMCPGTHSDPANTWPSEATPTGATPPPAPAADAAAPAQTPLELTSAKGHAIKAMLANMKATRATRARKLHSCRLHRG